METHLHSQISCLYYEFADCSARTKVFVIVCSNMLDNVLQSLICDVTVNLSLAEYAQGERYLFLKSEFCQEHSAPFLWSSCELLAALYAHRYLTFHEILLDCSNIFPRRSPMLCLRRTCYLHLYSTWFPGSIYSVIDLGVVMSPTWSRQQ